MPGIDWNPSSKVPAVILGLLMAALPSFMTEGRAAMTKVESGTYTPLYADPEEIRAARPNDGGSKPTEPPKRGVPGFLMDVHPATVKEYLDFLKAKPEWRRSKVPRVFADEGYLESWEGDLDPGILRSDSPVTRVSWFAAKAYCEWKKKTLPTVDQWEFAASPESQESRQGVNARDEITRRILEWYSQPNPEVLPPVGSTFANRFGVYDLHGLVWEWTLDFNSAMVTGESRGDQSLERARFCGTGSFGASDFRDYAGFMRFAFRSSLKASFTATNLGFRCVSAPVGE